MTRGRVIAIHAAIVALAAVVFLPGIHWGLPTREIDTFLFTGAQPWSGEKIIHEGGGLRADANRSADSDADPLIDRSKPIVLNDTPAKQAEIVRRYRLFSHQPDEMVTFMALARMGGRNLDPGMYQYGGLWIYPVGAMIKLGPAKVTPKIEHYLDYPEDFGRFYVIARLYSAMWGMAGAIAVFHLTRRMCAGVIGPIVAACCFILMPVVVNGAHEAKPHLAGASLMLWSALAAVKYVETGARRWWIATGALCGASLGMVLSAAVVFIVPLVMVMLRSETWKKRIAVVTGAVMVGIVVYCATNPFVPINLVRNPAVLKSNLGGLSEAKALVGKANDSSALGNAAWLIAEGASPTIAILGWIGLIYVRRHRTVMALLGVPATIVLLQFITLAAGKPGEFGRFAILPDAMLAILAAMALDHIFSKRLHQGVAATVLILGTSIFGLSYLAGCLEDTARTTTRIEAAKLIRQAAPGSIAMFAEPAPYNTPPLDFIRTKIVLLSKDGKIPSDDWPDVIVKVTDDERGPWEIAGMPYDRHVFTSSRAWFTNEISWAAKPVHVWVRKK